MKKILVILHVTTLFSLKLAAQEPLDLPPAGSYITNNTMTRFHGKWLWTDGIDSVILVFQTKKIHIPMNYGFFWDCLLGWHEYKRKGIVVESTLAYIGDTARSVFLGGNEAYGVNIATGSLTDISKKKGGHFA